MSSTGLNPKIPELCGPKSLKEFWRPSVLQKPSKTVLKATKLGGRTPDLGPSQAHPAKPGPAKPHLRPGVCCGGPEAEFGISVGLIRSLRGVMKRCNMNATCQITCYYG